MTQANDVTKYSNKDLKIIKAVHLESGAIYEVHYALTDEDMQNKASYLEEAYGNDCEILIEKE